MAFRWRDRLDGKALLNKVKKCHRDMAIQSNPISTTSKIVNSQIKSCSMHDLLYNIARQSGFCLIVYEWRHSNYCCCSLELTSETAVAVMIDFPRNRIVISPPIDSFIQCRQDFPTIV